MTDEIQSVETKRTANSSQVHPDAPPDSDDEINLLDLFLVLLKRKWFIIGFVVLSGVLALSITLLMTNIYRSDATILPREEEKTPSSMLSSALGSLGGVVAGELGLGGSGSLEKLQVVLQSRYLAERVIKKYDLLPTIFPDAWDETAKKWKTAKWFGLRDLEPPTIQSGIKKLIEDLLSVTSDSKMGTLKVSFQDKDPQKAKTVTEYLLIETSETMREVVLRDATENLKFFYEQLEKTSDSLLKAKIYESLAREIEKETFARAQKYYGFYVPDPPFAPDLDKQAKPNRMLICVLSVFVALFFGILTAFLLEYLSRLKTEDPERYQQLKNGLRLRRKRSRQSKEQKA
jgi:uncharacterized protein involved in exopolysaccharide biosynthesis